MTYTTRNTRGLTATESALLDCITAAGWWSVDPRWQTFEQQETLEFLWRAGYIERKAYGGWGAKATMQVKPVTAETVRALFASYGVAIAGDVLVCTGARRRSANGVSWAVQVAKGATLPAELWARFEANAYRNADLVVFELKKG